MVLSDRCGACGCSSGSRSARSGRSKCLWNMINLYAWLTNSARKNIILAVILLIAVGYIDYLTGYEVAFSIFYLLPILLVVWHIDVRAGFLFSFLAAGVGFLDDNWLVEHQYSNQGIPYWNTLVHLSFFGIFSALTGYAHTLLKKEREHSKLKSAMIHTVSHEFNNSLTVLASGLFLLRETEPAPGDETRLKVLTAMDETRTQMSRYIKNILNEARIEAGRFKLEKSALALRDIVKECLTPFRTILDTKQLELRLNMPELPVLVNADRDALALVISNLLSNAVKYTPKGGRLTVNISPRKESGMVVFSVEDTGVGISLEDMKQLAAEFYRTETGKSAAAGFGLGLNITKELLGLHGSRLEVFSEKGKGSRFFFELPAALPHRGEEL